MQRKKSSATKHPDILTSQSVTFHFLEQLSLLASYMLLNLAVRHSRFLPQNKCNRENRTKVIPGQHYSQTSLKGNFNGTEGTRARLLVRNTLASKAKSLGFTRTVLAV